MDRFGGSHGPTACQTCAKAKVRCEQLEGSKCMRCLRLNKECTVQLPGAHKRKKTRIPEIARIEHKLDGVAAILATAERQSAGTQQTTENTLLRDDQASRVQFLDQSFFYANEQEAQLVLNIYREKFTPHFPFVVVPQNVTPYELRQSKPFLYKVIMTIACQRSSSHQQTLSEVVKNDYIQRIMANGEQSFDLLQGLLVFLGWFHIHFQTRSQLSNPAHLLMAMLMDLGLHRPSGSRGTTGLPLHYLRTFYSEPQVPRQRTLEERRTYIGCYHLLTTISLCNREICVLRYTKYTDECLVTIDEMKEYPTDEYLVYQLRLHRIGEKIRRTLWDDPIDMAWGLSAPVGMCVRYLEIELRQFREVLPVDLAQHTLLRSYINTLEISLYGIALSDKFNDGDYGEYQLTRFNILRSCLIATKELLDQISDLPLEVRICTPSTCWSQFGQAVVVLSKLSLLENVMWKEIYDQNALEFSQEIDRVAQKFDRFEPKTVHPRLFITEAYLKIGSRLKLMKETHEKIRAAQVERERVLTDANFDLDLGDLLPMPMLDLLDGEFWQQVL